MGFPVLDSPAQITQAALIAAEIGSLPPTDSLASNADWPIYATNEPNQPDNCITVFDTVNQFDGRSMSDGEEWVHWGVQVRIRGATHPIGWQKAFQVFTFLSKGIGGRAGNLGVYVGENYYLIDTYAKIKGPLVLGIDAPKSKRSIFTVNALLVL